MPTQDGYREWAIGYDSPGNQLIEIEQPIVWEILGGLPVGVAPGLLVRPRRVRGLLVVLPWQYAPRTISVQMRATHPKELSCRPSSGTTM